MPEEQGKKWKSLTVSLAKACVPDSDHLGKCVALVCFLVLLVFAPAFALGAIAVVLAFTLPIDATVGTARGIAWLWVTRREAKIRNRQRRDAERDRQIQEAFLRNQDDDIRRQDQDYDREMAASQEEAAYWNAQEAAAEQIERYRQAEEERREAEAAANAPTLEQLSEDAHKEFRRRAAIVLASDMSDQDKQAILNDLQDTLEALLREIVS